LREFEGTANGTEISRSGDRPLTMTPSVEQGPGVVTYPTNDGDRQFLSLVEVLEEVLIDRVPAIGVRLQMARPNP